MVKRIATALFIVCVSTCYFSCKHEIPVAPVIDPGTGTGTVDSTATTAICFESDILPLFISNCAKSSCHDAASKNEGFQLDSYANIIVKDFTKGNASNTKIFKVLNETSPSKIMPQPPNTPLTADQKALIEKWINDGAANTTNCTTGCDTAKFTYTAAIKPILQTNCYGCHSGTATSGSGIMLDSYTGVKAMVDANKFYPSISHTGGIPMPQGGAKISDCKITQVKKWIDAGALNN